MRTGTRALTAATAVLVLGCLVALPALAIGEPARVELRGLSEDVVPLSIQRLTVTVYDAEGSLVDFPASENLVLVESNSGGFTSFVPYAERVATGTYQVQFAFPGAGGWTVVAAPDEPFTQRRSLMVEAREPVASVDPSVNAAAIALAVLGLLLIVLLGDRLRRARDTRQAAPNAEASSRWWW